ncbi:hypothetical protein U27_03115 [Candidatus Vecturithrix granuli]|uniref:Uncharacterized protein n=1 Tax=Vecturithrix granuli TaxID=1499967 RepID=A0A081BUZ8_VECG1|nr:hypothetical protein U27_03115 [Candidatus Vecturithrix granuli]
MKVSEIFEEEPVQWGLRGDPYLWRELKERLSETNMPENPEKLQRIIEEEYEKATGYPLSHQEPFFIERFQHGGMSSGGISPEFWVSTAIPMLIHRYDTL